MDALFEVLTNLVELLNVAEDTPQHRELHVLCEGGHERAGAEPEGVEDAREGLAEHEREA